MSGSPHRRAQGPSARPYTGTAAGILAKVLPVKFGHFLLIAGAYQQNRTVRLV